ncbi:hypothetical protein ACWEWX_28740, partial [Streptomyces asiaticus]
IPPTNPLTGGRPPPLVTPLGARGSRGRRGTHGTEGRYQHAVYERVTNALAAQQHEYSTPRP